jgi:hypothetical protein
VTRSSAPPSAPPAFATWNPVAQVFLNRRLTLYSCYSMVGSSVRRILLHCGGICSSAFEKLMFGTAIRSLVRGRRAFVSKKLIHTRGAWFKLDSHRKPCTG